MPTRGSVYIERRFLLRFRRAIHSVAAMSQGDLIRRVASRLGIACDSETTAPFLFRLTYPNGGIRYVLDSDFAVNRAASLVVSDIKPCIYRFLGQAGHPVPEYKVFFADAWARQFGIDRDQASAFAFAAELGYPVVVKPANSFRGRGVQLAFAPGELERAITGALAFDSMFIVQRYIAGEEYRLVVFDGAVRLAYEKCPLEIVGDGRSTCQQLIEASLEASRSAGIPADVTAADPRIDPFLANQGLARDAVPEAGRTCRAGLAAGFPAGGRLVERWNMLPAGLAERAIAVAQASGLRLVGLDILVAPSGTCYTIDVNSPPALEGYAALGSCQRERTEALVADLLCATGASAAVVPCEPA